MHFRIGNFQLSNAFRPTTEVQYAHLHAKLLFIYPLFNKFAIFNKQK